MGYEHKIVFYGWDGSLRTRASHLAELELGLNQLGAEGWEAISLLKNGTAGITAIFKRAVSNRPPAAAVEFKHATGAA